MERYIGVLKGMVSLMSNIDADLANKVYFYSFEPFQRSNEQQCIVMECLNHFPPHQALHTPNSHPDRYAIFPLPPNDPNLMLRVASAVFSRPWLRLLQQHYAGAPNAVSPEAIVLWKKYHAKYQCFVGSHESQLAAYGNRREDCYIWWLEGNRRRYGKVMIFAEVLKELGYTPLAIIKPYSPAAISENNEMATTLVDAVYGAMEVVEVKRIEGLVGRIEKKVGGPKCYLVGNW